MSENLPASAASASVPRCPWWRRASVLSAAIFVALLLNNSEAIFRTPIYETDDYAADSLEILKAKQFRLTFGNYCRFGFHHPGPAFFYVFGWGEMLFHDATQIVPTPFNGHLIALYALSAFFFAATLALIAARAGPASGWFLGLALLFAAWHFGAVGKFYQFIPGGLAFFVPWMPCFIVLPFLCFLVAAASVAAGGGRDLPLMTLAACFLAHGHVGMPLFLVPITLVAYAAFWRDTRRSSQSPWNLFRRQHWLAGVIIAIFVAPLVIDLFTAHPSNLGLIINHVRTSYGEGKGLVRPLLYFLHFGAYAAYPSQESIPALVTFDAAGMLSFFLNHWRAYVLWLGSVVLWLVTTRRAGDSQPESIREFSRRLLLILAVATGLSLVWGSIQEGTMFYYNALFNFAIYYTWLLVVALSVARWIQNRAWSWPARMRSAALIGLILLAVTAFIREKKRFRATPDADEQRGFAAAVERALLLDPVQPKYLNFDWQGGGQTTRLALYLERKGVRWWVREYWPLLFGEERIVREGVSKPGQPVPSLESSFWKVVWHPNLAAQLTTPTSTLIPLTRDYDLIIYPGKSETAR